MIQLDTSVIIDAFTGAAGGMRSALHSLLATSEPVTFSSVVLYEWLRGPRRAEDVAAVDATLRRDRLVEFGPPEAARAAELYRIIRRARAREVDLAIAACALTHRARLWTLNPEDFSDIPGLTLYRPT